ncbi:hypothetical protein AVEN_144249-1 [Araneus ventricosus]|uniref:Uncharacterized protein n=1 Tax=Araneus ventricosus TaxID=182803 RepID=A0A4Y2JP52_ARAVE|nr:hypothetical protein AVEN_144249-1 [Araneus ventricosus]
MLQHTYSNRSEFLNILVYGPADWTSRLLQTLARERPLKFSSLYSFSFQRNITTCGILMTVSVWQMDYLIKRGHFLRSSCLSSESTIMFELNVKDTLELFLTLHPKINLTRRDISRSVLIILVASKVRVGISANQLHSVSRRNSLAFTNTGFRLKARYDLSAFLECSVDSTEEFNAVIFTAIDVSLLAQ